MTLPHIPVMLLRAKQQRIRRKPIGFSKFQINRLKHSFRINQARNAQHQRYIYIIIYCCSDMITTVGGISIATIAQAFYQYVLKGGYAFAIDANVSLNTSYYKVPMAQAKAFLITEEGLGKVIVYPFRQNTSCLHAGSKLKCCLVAFDAYATQIGAGGIGFSQQTIRKNGTRWLSQQK